MVSRSVLEEIDKRINRLNALIEIAEERAGNNEKPLPKPPNQSAVYMLISIAWLLIGAVLLYYLQQRYLGGRGLHLCPAFYAVVVLMILVVGGLYYFMRRDSEEFFDLEDQSRAAKKVLKEFYIPLKKALQSGDSGRILAIADRLLEDPTLGEALNRVKEGDPRTIAYALYLYLSARGELGGPAFDAEEEIVEALEIVDNRAVSALLRTLIAGDKLSPGEKNHGD